MSADRLTLRLFPVKVRLKTEQIEPAIAFEPTLSDCARYTDSALEMVVWTRRVPPKDRFDSTTAMSFILKAPEITASPIMEVDAPTSDSEIDRNDPKFPSPITENLEPPTHVPAMLRAPTITESSFAKRPLFDRKLPTAETPLPTTKAPSEDKLTPNLNFPHIEAVSDTTTRVFTERPLPRSSEPRTESCDEIVAEVRHEINPEIVEALVETDDKVVIPETLT
jgi:hypothetical protein